MNSVLLIVFAFEHFLFATWPTAREPRFFFLLATKRTPCESVIFWVGVLSVHTSRPTHRIARCLVYCGLFVPEPEANSHVTIIGRGNFQGWHLFENGVNDTRL